MRVPWLSSIVSVSAVLTPVVVLKVASNWLAGPVGVPSSSDEPSPLERVVSTVTVGAAGTEKPPQLPLKGLPLTLYSKKPLTGSITSASVAAVPVAVATIVTGL